MSAEEDKGKNKDAHVETSDAVSAQGSEVTRETISELATPENISVAPGSCETIPAIHSYQIKPVLADK